MHVPQAPHEQRSHPFLCHLCESVFAQIKVKYENTFQVTMTSLNKLRSCLFLLEKCYIHCKIHSLQVYYMVSYLNRAKIFD